MGIDIGSFLRHAAHIRSNQLKHAPGIKAGHEQQAADIANAITAPLVETALIAYPAVAVNALHVKPAQLTGEHFVDPHEAAEYINQFVEGQLTPGKAAK